MSTKTCVTGNNLILHKALADTHVVVDVEFEASLLDRLLYALAVAGVPGRLSTPLPVLEETTDLVVSTPPFFLRAEPIHPTRPLRDLDRQEGNVREVCPKS